MANLVEAVKAHALKNYEHDGWDYIVEAHTDSEIETLIEGATTEAEAIERAGYIVGIMKEQEG